METIDTDELLRTGVSAEQTGSEHRAATWPNSQRKSYRQNATSQKERPREREMLISEFWRIHLPFESQKKVTP